LPASWSILPAPRAKCQGTVTGSPGSLVTSASRRAAPPAATTTLRVHALAAGGTSPATMPFVPHARPASCSKPVTSPPPFPWRRSSGRSRRRAEVAGHLWERGWAESNAGNFSIDVTGDLPSWLPATDGYPAGSAPEPYPELAGRAFWVSAAGSRMRDLGARTAGELWPDPDRQRRRHVRRRLGAALVPAYLGAAHPPRRARGAQAPRCRRPRRPAHPPTELIALTHLPALTQERSAGCCGR